jgi:hypothetical protein
LEELFGENAELSQNYNACINTMATRIATVFASLRVIFPSLSLHVFFFLKKKECKHHAYCKLKSN